MIVVRSQTIKSICSFEKRSVQRKQQFVMIIDNEITKKI